MERLKIAKIIYYVLVFGWLLQIVFEGYTQHLIVPTIVLILYGLGLNYSMRKKNKKK